MRRFSLVMPALVLVAVACGGDGYSGSHVSVSPVDGRARLDATSQRATPPGELVTTAPPEAEDDGGRICLVLDRSGSLAPASIEQAIAGLEQAASRFSIGTFVVESPGSNELGPILDALAAAHGCDLIIVVGAWGAAGVGPWAAAHPDNRFVVIDASGGDTTDSYPNLLSVVFREDQPGFLVGYAAAWTAAESPAHCKVGVLGGVTYFAGTIVNATMVGGSDSPVGFGEPSREDLGFARGVEYYSRGAAEAVEAVGAYLADPSPDAAAGYAIAQALIGAGARVIFPVTGDAGLGVIAAIRDRRAAGDPCAGFAIGTDGDFAAQDGVPDDVVLTSSLKNLDRAVYHQVEAFLTRGFSGGIDYEDLSSGGVGYAEIVARDIGATGDLLRELAALREGIIDGSVCTMIPCDHE